MKTGMVIDVKRVVALALACILMVGFVPAQAIETPGFVPAPSTAYSQSFIDLCDGQQWFMDEVERVLNAGQKTMNRLDSREDLTEIVTLGFWNQGISGQIPRAIGELVGLRNLFLGNNQLTSPIPVELYTLPALRNVDLSYNAYPAQGIPAGFGTMASLETLILTGNQFTGTIPDAILNNTTIKVLDISSNQLTGGIPTGINGMTGLIHLALSDNSMGGVLPDISALTTLQNLSLWGMGLTGAFHESIYSLTTLQVLDLAQNQLEGALDSRLGDLTALQILALGENKLSGSLPAELAALTELQRLDLADNEFRNVIPDAFGGMTKAVDIHLENNKLRGFVPDSLLARNQAGTLVYVGDNYLTGEYLSHLANPGEIPARNTANNFGDLVTDTRQYQLTGTNYVVLNESSAVNLYSLLRNTPLSGGGFKPLLLPEEYSFTYTMLGILPEPCQITRDSKGIYALALSEIPRSAAIPITIQILDNDGSEYSRVTLLLTTEAPAAGGLGGGGGGGSITPSPSKTVSHVRYINGFPDGTFQAETPVTREQLAKMLSSALELEEQTYTSRYSDVAGAYWAAKVIEATSRQKYFTGYVDGSFRPITAITRGEFVAVVARVAGLPLEEGISVEALPFSDVEDAWYLPYLAATVEAGYVDGYTDGTFRPNADISRAEAVKVINLMLGRNEMTQPGGMVCPFPDVEQEHWAYRHILEASVDHGHEEG